MKYPQLQDKAWLEDVYRTRSMPQIAKEFGFGEWAVWAALKRHGIPAHPHTLTLPQLHDRAWLEAAYTKEGGCTPIARALGCCTMAVWNALRVHGITLRPPKQCTLTNMDIERLVQRYVAGESLSTLTTAYRTSDRVIKRLLCQQGITPRSYSEAARVYPLDETAFDSITEASAYWAGFLLGDGALAKGRYSHTITLCLTASDRGHVERFRAFLHAGHPIAFQQRTRRRVWIEGRRVTARPAVRLTVTSKRLVAALEGFGVTTTKTTGAQLIGLEENRHAWRGLIDADGWLGQGPDGTAHIGLSASWPLLQQFQQFVQRQVPAYRSSLYRERRCQGAHGDFAAKGRRAEALIDLLYHGCTLALPRKWTIADAILHRQQPLFRLTQNARPSPASSRARNSSRHSRAGDT